MNLTDAADRPEVWFPALASDIFDSDRIGMVQTDREGRWSVESFPSDRELKVKIAIGHPDYRVQILKADFSTLTEQGYFGGTAKATLTTPARISGTLQNAEGRPLAGVPVFLFSPVDPTKNAIEPAAEETRTGEDGAFAFKARVPGNYTVVGLPKALTPTRETFTLERGEQLKLTVPPGRVLKGRVVDHRNRPVPNVNILFAGWVAGPGMSTNPTIATSDAAGNWTWQNAPAGTVFGHALYPSGTLGEWWEENNQPISIIVPQEDLE